MLCWLCWVVGLSRLYCGSEVTVGHGRMCGCSTRQPVEAWLYVVNTQFSNLWPWRYIKTFFFLVFFFEPLFFGDCKFYNVLFIEFLTLSTKVGEVSDWNIYLNEGSYLALNIVRLDQFPRRFVDTIPSIKLTANRPLEIKNKFHPKAECVDWLCGDRKTQSIAVCVCIFYKRYQG